MSQRNPVARLIVSLIRAVGSYYDPLIEKDVKDILKIEKEKEKDGNR